MTDFEAYKGEFKNWSRQKHKYFLNHALEVIVSHVREFVGFTSTAPNPHKRLQYTYEQSILDTIMHFATDSAFGRKKPISLVFAEHPQFPLSDVKKLFKLVNWGDSRLSTCTTGDPASSCPLQLADVIAYEVRCLQRVDGSPTNRYPLCRLKELGGRFTIAPAHRDGSVGEILHPVFLARRCGSVKVA